MNEDIDECVTRLLNYAYEHNVGFALTGDVEPDQPSAAYPSRRFIIVNTQWRDHQQLPYTIAHEIGHVINGDPDVAYFHPSRNSMEGEANRFAVRLLHSLFEVEDSQRFIENFHIPGYMSDYVREIYTK